MKKVESIACATAWVLMNALIILVIAEPFGSGRESARNGGAFERTVPPPSI